MDDRDAKALEHQIDKLKDFVDISQLMESAAKQPSLLLPVVYGLVQALDQLYVHFRALDRKIERWEQEADEEDDDDF